MEGISNKLERQILYHLEMGDSFDGMVAMLRVQPSDLAFFYKQKGLLRGRKKLTKEDRRKLRELRRTSFNHHPAMPIEQIHERTGIDIEKMMELFKKDGLDHAPAPRPILVQQHQNGNFNLRMDQCLLGYALPKDPLENKTSGIQTHYTDDIR